MNEELRNQSVRQFEELDLKSDLELKNIVSLAAKICKTPISSINILDKDTQWLLVKKGLLIEQTPREISFCTHTIKRKNLMLVNDTHNDPRFAENPLVISGPKIRFYAGYPLISQEGYRIGALCVLDSKPHSLTKEQQLFLKILGKHAISVMEFKLSINKYKKVVKDLKDLRKYKSKSDLKLRAMFESFSDAYFLLGRNGEIIDFNRAAYNFINDVFDIKLSYGRMISDFLASTYRDDFNRYYSSALNGKKIQVEELTDYREKGLIWWECDFEPVKDDFNAIVGVSYVTRNITERKLNEQKIIAQNNVLAQIAVIQSHDYRGPLASILGLMNLIAADDFTASKEYLVMLHSAVNKLDQKIREVVDMVNDSSLR